MRARPILLLAASAATAMAAAAAAPSCSTGLVGSCVQSLGQFSTEVASFCSSLLHVKTSTVVVPATTKETVTNVVKTITVSTYLFSQKTKTISYTFTYTWVDYTATVTETSTYTVPYFTATPAAKRLGRAASSNSNSVSPAAHVSTDRNGGALGFVASVVTSACSCLVTTPTVTTTQTTTSTKTVKGTTFVTKYTSTLTFPNTRYTDVSEIDTTISIISTTTVLNVVTKTVKGTQCGGASPTVKLQIHDTDPARTDVFNGQYAMVPYLVDDLFNGRFYNTTDIAAASLFVLMADGRLKTGPDLFANVDYFGPDELPHFLRKATYTLEGYTPFNCSLTAQDPTLLGCTAATGEEPILSILQTCPIYYDFYGTPFAFGNFLPTDSPDCYEFLFRVIPVCTPK